MYSFTFSPYAVRRINDLMMMLERAFVESRGLPFREDYYHVLVSPSALNDYDGSYFSALYDFMWKIDHDHDDVQTWNNLKKYLSIVVFHINAAAQLLRQSLI